MWANLQFPYATLDSLLFTLLLVWSVLIWGFSARYHIGHVHVHVWRVFQTMDREGQVTSAMENLIADYIAALSVNYSYCHKVGCAKVPS